MENPMKYLDDPSKIEEFAQNFPTMDLELMKDNYHEKTLEGQKSYRRKLAGNMEKLSQKINSKVKAISGCEINVKYHEATLMKFSHCKPEDKIVSFILTCRTRGSCGVKEIKFKVFANNKATIEFVPVETTNATSFPVKNECKKGDKPRCVV